MKHSSKAALKNKKKREAKKARDAEKASDPPQHESSSFAAPRNIDHNDQRIHSRTESAGNATDGRRSPQKISQQRGSGLNGSGSAAGLPPAPVLTPELPAALSPEASPNSPHDKKLRGLLKKMRAIDDLKMRLAGGEKLEDTQMKKIATEDVVRKELDSLGYTG